MTTDESIFGQTIAVVSAGVPTKRFIFERARDLGVKVILLDSAQSWASDLVSDGILASFIPINFGRQTNLVALDCAQALKPFKPLGVCTFCEVSVEIAALTAQLLGLPHSPPELVRKCRDKQAVRSALNVLGIDNTRNFRIPFDASDSEVSSLSIDFPAVLKPVSGADSIGVVKISNLAELIRAFHNCKKTVANLRVKDGAIAVGYPGESHADSKKTSSGFLASDIIPCDFILEEYIEGDEVDIDVVLSSGSLAYGAVSDNGPTAEPFFSETWAVCPSRLSLEVVENLVKLAFDAVTGLGFKDGVFHVEGKVEKFPGFSKPRLLEINPRMGGGFIGKMHRLVYGRDLIDDQFRIACGLSCPSSSMPLIPRGAFSYITPTSTLSGTYCGPAELIDRKSLNKHMEFIQYVKPGDYIVGSGGKPTWLCEILFFSPNGFADNALNAVQAVAMKVLDEIISKNYLKF